MPFPARGDSFPTKDQVADYMEEYAQHFRLPVRNGVKVDRLWQKGSRFVVSSGSQRFESENVVVAMANYQKPRIPEFAGELAPGFVQLHSRQYRNPSQLQAGGVLIVGVGQLWSRYRDRSGPDASDLDFRERVGAHSFPHRKFRDTQFPGASSTVPGSSRAQPGNSNRAEAAPQAAAQGVAARTGETQRPGRRGRGACPERWV